MKNYQDIFEDFDSLSYEAWKESAIKTIKGADFDKKLTFKTNEDITVQPYYTFTESTFAEVSTTPKDLHKPWDIIESIKVDSLENANTKALQALNNGATAIEFDLKDIASFNENKLAVLLKNINTQIAPIFLLNTEIEVDKKGIYANAIDGYGSRQMGANAVQEIAFTLAKLHEFILSKASQKPNNIWLRVSTGNNYFMEIAKTQVLRSLCNTLLEQYHIPLENIYIQSVSMVFNKTIADYYTNMLRNTTEAMAAVIGGSDGIAILPHDVLTEDTKDMGKRVARNVSLILQHESYFGSAPNPIAGTYYIQELSQELMDKSWALFLEIEDQGGYNKAYESGFIKEAIEKNRAKQQKDFNKRKTILVGINDFPNLQEDNIEQQSSVFENRLSSGFEALKLKISKRKNPIKAYALVEKSDKMGSLRFSYSVNFWGCAGIVLNKIEGDNIETQINSLQKTDYDLLLICSSDESWNDIVENISDKLPKKGQWLLAGNAKDQLNQELLTSIDNYYYSGIDLVEFINTVVDKV